MRERFNIVTYPFLAAPIEAGCSSDDECPSFQACVSRSCVNPCTTNNPCSQSARCSVTNHRAICTCPPGTTGDPYTQCSPSKNPFSNKKYYTFILNLDSLMSIFSAVKIGECDTDSECPDNRACNQHQCVNPCDNGLPCGKNAQCTPTGHRAVCKCPTGWGGDPSTECFQCKNTSFLLFKQ